jgi:hypothetical protein
LVEVFFFVFCFLFFFFVLRLCLRFWIESRSHTQPKLGYALLFAFHYLFILIIIRSFVLDLRYYLFNTFISFVCFFLFIAYFYCLSSPSRCTTPAASLVSVNLLYASVILTAIFLCELSSNVSVPVINCLLACPCTNSLCLVPIRPTFNQHPAAFKSPFILIFFQCLVPLSTAKSKFFERKPCPKVHGHLYCLYDICLRLRVAFE